MKPFTLFLLILLSISVGAQIKGSLWDVDGIHNTPGFTKEYRDSVYEIVYTGLNYKGVPKKTFAYYATPGSLSGRAELDKNLSKATMPLLFVNGTNDPAFFLDSYIKTYQLAKKKQLSLQIGLKHGYYTEGMGYEIREPYFFIDHYLKRAPGLPVFSNEKRSRDGSLKATLQYNVPIEKAWLHYTTDTTGNLLERKWEKKELLIRRNKIKSGMPPTGSVMWYLHVVDKQGLQSSGKIHVSG